MAQVIERIVLWNISGNPIFIGFRDLKVSFVGMIAMVKTPFDRAHQPASNDISFASGTDCDSNMFTEYCIFLLFTMVQKNIFINIS